MPGKLDIKRHSPSILFLLMSINDTHFELSVFSGYLIQLAGSDSRINELRFSDPISLSFKMRLMSVTCFCGDIP